MLTAEVLPFSEAIAVTIPAGTKLTTGAFTAALVPTLAVYGWFAFRRFYGASRLYATFAAVVLLLGQGLIAMILNIAVIALLIVTA